MWDCKQIPCTHTHAHRHTHRHKNMHTNGDMLFPSLKMHVKCHVWIDIKIIWQGHMWLQRLRSVDCEISPHISIHQGLQAFKQCNKELVFWSVEIERIYCYFSPFLIPLPHRKTTLEHLSDYFYLPTSMSEPNSAYIQEQVILKQIWLFLRSPVSIND
jgi:hypothetical protein